MIERLYVNNFRCFDNFALDLAGRRSVLIIGKNGSGKSTLQKALSLFQSVCRGPSRVRDVVSKDDFAQHRTHIPMSFEIEAILGNRRFKYVISFEMPESADDPRIEAEVLTVDGVVIFSRQEERVVVADGAKFNLTTQVVALPLIDEHLGGNAIKQIKSYLATMILIAPMPANISGYSEEASDEIEQDASNFSSWFNALLLRYPATYGILHEYLTSVIPDLDSFENMPRGEKGKQLIVKFAKGDSGQTLSVDFKELSDGEKCFFLSALIIASNKVNGSIFCLWDEPDNYLALPEVSHFITQLRKMTNRNGQFIATSHHPETIRSFTDESTLVLTRKSHLEPTVVRRLADLSYQGDLINALIRDELIG